MRTNEARARLIHRRTAEIKQERRIKRQRRLDAACMAVCPARAIYRDPQFGAVLVDRGKCLGCRYCSWACEFGAPQFDRDGLMTKCDMCIDRLRKGLAPACVESCCGGAITIGPVETARNAVREHAAKRISAASRLL